MKRVCGFSAWDTLVWSMFIGIKIYGMQCHRSILLNEFQQTIVDEYATIVAPCDATMWLKNCNINVTLKLNSNKMNGQKRQPWILLACTVKVSSTFANHFNAHGTRYRRPSIKYLVLDFRPLTATAKILFQIQHQWLVFLMTILTISCSHATMNRCALCILLCHL